MRVSRIRSVGSGPVAAAVAALAERLSLALLASALFRLPPAARRPATALAVASGATDFAPGDVFRVAATFANVLSPARPLGVPSSLPDPVPAEPRPLPRDARWGPSAGGDRPARQGLELGRRDPMAAAQVEA